MAASDHENVAPNHDRDAREFELAITRLTWWMVAIVGGSAGFFAAGVSDNVGEFLGIVGISFMLAAASAVAGALLGFLFGIPKTLEQDRRAEDVGPRYLANTNLEQISDWLTKILVGIGLVQIGRAGPAIARFGHGLAPALGDAAGSQAFGVSLCVLSLIGSFIFTFLWTRTRLRRQLELADRDVESAVRRVVKEVADADALALSLAERQLTGQNPPTIEELTDSLRAASKPVLVQIYQRAEDQRSRSWGDPARHDVHASTVPVFQALIANDPARRFHRHFGSLGFALSDLEHPDLDHAVESLTIAIAARGDPRRYGYTLYEWSRAACRIAQATQNGVAPDNGAIEADLRTSAIHLSARFFGPADGGDARRALVAGWLQTAGLTYTDLRTSA